MCVSWVKDKIFILLHAREEGNPEDIDNQTLAACTDELVEALLDGDLGRADRLVALGADVNAVPANEDPPLHSAVEQEDAGFLERLLRYGADPSLRDPGQRLTPLMLVRRMLSKKPVIKAKHLIRYDDLAWVRVTADEPVASQIDGDFLGLRAEMTFRVVPGALSVVAPPAKKGSDQQ